MAKQSTYFITFQKLGSKKQYKLKVNGHINPLHYIFEDSVSGTGVNPINYGVQGLQTP